MFSIVVVKSVSSCGVYCVPCFLLTYISSVTNRYSCLRYECGKNNIENGLIVKKEGFIYEWC